MVVGFITVVDWRMRYVADSVDCLFVRYVKKIIVPITYANIDGVTVRITRTTNNPLRMEEVAAIKKMVKIVCKSESHASRSKQSPQADNRNG